MKLNYTYGPGTLTITKIFEPGEKYISAYLWDRKDGRATKELVESMLPGCKFVGVQHGRVASPITLAPTSWTKVLVERTE